MAVFLEAVAAIAIALASLWFGVDGLIVANHLQALAGVGGYLIVWLYCFVRLSGASAAAHAVPTAGHVHRHA